MRNSAYWILLGITWFLINGAIAYGFHMAWGIPWHKCFNLYVGFGVLIYGLFKSMWVARD